MSSKDLIFTYQTRCNEDASQDAILKKMAAHLSQIERYLFADFSRGKKINSLKSDYLTRHQITARHFNGIRVQLEGKIDACQQLRDNHIEKTQAVIEKLKKVIASLEKKLLIPALQRKKQQLQRMEKKLKNLLSDREKNKVRLCFGSKKLFNAQFNLEENGYSSHEEWKKDWNYSRNNSFFLIGSKDETAGNQSCIATLNEDGSFSLKIRLFNAGTSRYLVLDHIYFKYGHEKILASLESCKERARLKKLNDPSYKLYGEAISYRFKLADNGRWYVFASTSLKAMAICTNKELGAIGIDINEHHVALTETDRFGNVIHSESYPLVTYGKSKEQSEALIGDLSAKMIHYAKQAKKPIVLEELNFEKKKQNLKQESASYARMLSSFAYHKIRTMIQSCGVRHGVEIGLVDPAYTSTMGRMKYAERYGLSVHQAAALCIARRYLGVSEKVPRQTEHIPDGKKGHVALKLPARNRGERTSAFWAKVHRRLRAVLAAHFWAIKTSILEAAARPPDETRETSSNFAGGRTCTRIASSTA